MKEVVLTDRDKLRLKADIKISLVIGLVVSIALVVIIGLIPLAFVVLGKRPSDGFVTRGLYIVGLLFVPFLVICWTNILKYIDLKIATKIIFKTEDFKVLNTRDTAFILTQDETKRKIKIDNKLVPLIKQSRPLSIEICKFSKSLLFISQDTDNLLDRL